MNRQITEENMQRYQEYLKGEEKSRGTIEKYMRDLRAFAAWLSGQEVTKELAAQWKAHLTEESYAPVTVNSMLSAVNGFFKFMKWGDLRVKFLKIQRKIFREPSKVLNLEEYRRLLLEARAQGQERLALLMEAICGTGIRISEVKYITVEAARAGRAEIALKNKIRVILLPGKLCRKLLKYARKTKTASGEIFLTRNGKSLSRRQSWAEMKQLCRYAGIEGGKVFPHNLRHLFARTFYRACQDIVGLADVLGHSSIETTRLYLRSTGTEHIRRLESLCLIS